MSKLENTMQFNFGKELDNPVRAILKVVCSAMKEKGYDPANQLIGYLVSGDPTYVTSYKNARTLVMSIDRDEIMEEIVSGYIKQLME